LKLFTPNEPVRILVADDHTFLRAGIEAILGGEDDMRVVGEASSGEEAVSAFAALRPDLTLMDLQMPGFGGVEAIRRIRALDEGARVIVLTTFAGDAQARAALEAGAKGYLLKNALRLQMLDAIRHVHRGGTYIDEDVSFRLTEHANSEPLSDRELRALRLIALGRTNSEIALELAVSTETVKMLMKTLFLKLGVSDRSHAVTVAIHRGFITI
jgi:DNA-binding NarL/FixJ family response regulator